METKKMKFIMAMRDYFGYKEGEGLKGFADEVKKLNEADRAWFAQALTTVGYEIEAEEAKT